MSKPKTSLWIILYNGVPFGKTDKYGERTECAFPNPYEARRIACALKASTPRVPVAVIQYFRDTRTLEDIL